MMVDLSALAFSVRKHLATQGISLPLGHAQQLAVAAAGFGTLAAYQSAPNDFVFDQVMHWVVDVNLLDDRARELGLPPEQTSTSVQAALEALLPLANFHTSSDSFAEAIQEYVEDATYNSEAVSSQTAMANGSLSEVYMPLALWSVLDVDVDGSYEEQILGSVSLDPDPERVYYGHRVAVEATLYIPRLSKRLFAEPDLEVTHAELEWFGHSRDDDDELENDGPPLISLAEALSLATGLDEADTQFLDFDEISDESDDGAVYGLTLDFSRTADDEGAERLRARHPSMTVRVRPGFFDNVRRDKDGEMF